MIKQCIICNKKFKSNYPIQICCSKECRKINLQNWLKQYERSDKRQQYINSDKYKLIRSNYTKTPKRLLKSKLNNRKWYAQPENKQRKKEYGQSPKVQEFEHSEKRILDKKLYQQKEKYKQWRKQYLKRWNKLPTTPIVNLRKRLKRRAAKYHIIELFTAEHFMQKAAKCKGKCPCCHKYFNNNIRRYWLTIDHYYPIKRAYEDFLKTGVKREYTINDIGPLCLSCNSSKRDKIILP